ncbi:MAG TPA: TIGR00725 family protein [Thermoplasmatales archaeon]|nr:TIGR00725 family protein [Thermoplasmatales archaeon]
MYVSVIGGEQCSKEIYELAMEVGRRIAEMKAILITGGRGGVMEAVCRGAKEKNGITIGILPSNDRKEGNKFLDYAIVTGIGYARNILVVLNGDIVIAIDGHYGTLSEISFALEYGKPVYGLLSWEIGIKNFNNVEELFEEIEKDIRENL